MSFRPMNSRGLSPHLTLFFLFVQLLLEIRNYFEIPSYQGSLCVYYAYGIFPLQAICFIMILLYFVRYFSIINLNENKHTMYQRITLQKNIELTQKVRSRFLKIISSTYFTLGVVVLAYFTLVLIYTILLASYSYVGQYATLTIIKIIHNCILIGTYLLSIVTFVLDALPNWNLILKCRWIQYVVFNDPYYFRLQILLFVPFMIYNLILELWSLATTLNYYDIVKNAQTSMILNTVAFNILLAIDVVFPILLTILDLILTKLRKRSNTAHLDAIFEDPVLLSLFTRFCEMEFSIENLAFYQDIRNFKSTQHDPLGIYYRYLNGAGSVMEVNVPRKKCQEIFERLKKGDIDVNLFNDLEKDCLGNLSDTYSRFLFSSDYVKNRSIQKKELEMLEGKSSK
jgi:hypothetical protein